MDSYGLFSYVPMLLNYNNNDFATWAATWLFCKEGSSQDLDTFGTSGFKWRRDQFGTTITEPANLENGNPNPEVGTFV